MGSSWQLNANWDNAVISLILLLNQWLYMNYHLSHALPKTNWRTHYLHCVRREWQRGCWQEVVTQTLLLRQPLTASRHQYNLRTREVGGGGEIRAEGIRGIPVFTFKGLKSYLRVQARGLNLRQTAGPLCPWGFGGRTEARLCGPWAERGPQRPWPGRGEPHLRSCLQS